MKLKSIVQYKGTGYCGFSKQANEPTIEAALVKALSVVLKRKPVISVAGRTDSGVHALGQVISFRAGVKTGFDEMRYRLNSLLPEDIQIRKIEAVEDDFDARHSAVARQYVYYILNRRYASMVHDDFCFSYAQKMDIKMMRKAAKNFTGVHDFKSFAAAEAKSSSFVREVSTFKIENKSDFFDAANKDMIKITVKANAFLHHMVRNMVGTLVEVGLGNRKPEAVEIILKSKDRKKAGPTAAAKGLYLEKVYY
ncbi:hypothetical protein LCGC14_0847920 [marine sediment metagenome]|uniref:Pseudouridine synthase I TruA alpha/beta domain-containing protein n=1 Tax=marine sediment metagenome TaxID=412755 RepID=A0A0F9PB50_9ZZZZ